jgi:putative acetyltransferase
MSAMLPWSAGAHFTSLRTRAACFEDVPDVLRLIQRAVEHGCRGHYDPHQRRAVYASYAATLFVDTWGPFETIVAEQQGQVVAVAQLDLADERLRALFVDAHFQQRGVGQTLLAHMEARAVKRGCMRLHGAMSLNAVPFYLRAGFRRCLGPERLVTLGVSVPVVRMEKDLS